MRKVKSCGMIIFRDQDHEFLVLCHPHRYDLPKGHLKSGESDLECAWRELKEETGLTRRDIKLDPHFRYEETYLTCYRRFGNEEVEKTVVLYLGRLVSDRKVRLGEHQGYKWMRWAPPHVFQEKTIQGLLQRLETYLLPPNRSAVDTTGTA